MRRFTSVRRMISERWIDGLLLIGGGFSQRFVSQLKKHQIAMTAIGGNYSDENVDSVYADGFGGTYQAVQHLIDLGHREIAFIDGPAAWRTNIDKKEGYVSALMDNGLDFDPALVAVGDYSAQSGYSCMKKLTEKSATITAVCVALDGMAIGARRFLNEIGLHIPNDVSMIGFEDSWIATHFDPPLSTVRVDKHEMGIIGARRLFESLDRGSRQKATKSVVSTELILRDSCKEL